MRIGQHGDIHITKALCVGEQGYEIGVLTRIATDEHEVVRPRRIVNVADNLLQGFRVADSQHIVENVVTAMLSANIAVIAGGTAFLADVDVNFIHANQFGHQNPLLPFKSMRSC